METERIAVIEVALTHLALVVLAIVHTGPAQHWIRAQIQQRVTERLYGSLTVGELDFALFGDVALRKVVILDESGSEIVALDSLELSLDWWSLFEGAPVIDRVALDGLRLALAQDEKGVLNLQRLVKVFEAPSADGVAVHPVRVQLSDTHQSRAKLERNRLD